MFYFSPRSFTLALLILTALTLGVTCDSMAEPTTDNSDPVRIVVLRLTHTHVHWLLGRPRDRQDIQIVGIYEPNTELAHRYLKQHGLPEDLLHTDLEAMLDTTTPEAACLFGNIFEHRDHTLACAKRGIHVMVEKPLAVNLHHAREMAAAASEAGIHLLTNYETTWYASNHAVKQLVESGDMGDIRRIVVRCGHQGPIEIGCNPEFLEWLTDPKLNGGGALTDFGCYGANLATWLMDGQRPTSVFAVTKQIKPDKYPNVDDDATILLDYPQAVVSVEASWNWPVPRKEMDVYFSRGEVKTQGADITQARHISESKATTSKHSQRPAPVDDPFAYLAAVVRGKLQPAGLSSLPNNLIVMEILNAAACSAKTGKRIQISSTD